MDYDKVKLLLDVFHGTLHNPDLARINRAAAESLRCMDAALALPQQKQEIQTELNLTERRI